MGPCVALSRRSADFKRGRRKGATSKNVKNRQKVSKSFSTLFDNFRAGQKTSKIVKKCQKVFRHFSTIFARHLFSGPFCNPLRRVVLICQDKMTLSETMSDQLFEIIPAGNGEVAFHSRTGMRPERQKSTFLSSSSDMRCTNPKDPVILKILRS